MRWVVDAVVTNSCQNKEHVVEEAGPLRKHPVEALKVDGNVVFLAEQFIRKPLGFLLAVDSFLLVSILFETFLLCKRFLLEQVQDTLLLRLFVLRQLQSLVVEVGYEEFGVGWSILQVLLLQIVEDAKQVALYERVALGAPEEVE